MAYDGPTPTALCGIKLYNERGDKKTWLSRPCL